MFLDRIFKKRPFRGLRRGVSTGNTYPYPRTHTTVMVVPRVGASRSDWTSSASSCDDSPTSSTNAFENLINNNGVGSDMNTGYPRPRPPLNRAIPPIPESRSNESIMSQASQVKSVSTNPAGVEVAIVKGGDETMGIVVEKEDTSVVIENKMAQNLGAKTASERLAGPRPTSTIIKPKESRLETRKIQSRSEPPKSPLLSMAHSVRSRLSKLGNRFGRSDSRSPIRTSTSLITMKREKSDELANKSTTGMLKSSSMDEPGTSRIPQPASSKTGIPVLRQSGASLIPSPIGPTAIAMGSPSVQQKVFKPLPAKAEVTVETSIVRETTTASAKSTIETSSQEVTNLLISPVSNTTTTSSNTDTIYSGQCSTTTRPLSSLATSDTSGSISKTPTTPETAPEQQHLSKISQPSKLKPPTTITASLPKIEANKKVEAKVISEEEPVVKTQKTSTGTKSVASKMTKVLTPKSMRTEKSTSKKLPSPKPKQRTTVFGKRYNSVEIEDKSYEPEAKTPRKSASFIENRPTTNGHKPDVVDGEESTMKFFNKLNPFAPSERKKLDLRKIHSVNKNRRAPLAEFESTRVENSPAVEIPPSSFDNRLNSSSSPRRIIPATVPATGIASRYLTSPSMTIKNVRTIEDANGNLVVVESEEMTFTNAQEIPNLSSSLQSNASCLSTSPHLVDQTGFDTHRSGLIDDEIQDQPMLISASSYTLIDELDAPILKRRRNSFDSDEPTFVADINDNIQSHKRPSGGGVMPESAAKSDFAAVEECLARMSMNGEDHEETNRASSKPRTRSKNDLPTVCATVASTSDVNKPRSIYEESGELNSNHVYFEQLANYESAKQDLAAMKAQLIALQENLLELSNAAGDEASATSADEDEFRHRLEALEKENEELRRQLLDRDQIINELKSKIAAQS